MPQSGAGSAVVRVALTTAGRERPIRPGTSRALSARRGMLACDRKSRCV